MTIMLSCKEVSGLVSDGQDMEMSVTDRTLLRLHMVMCDGCRNVEKQMLFLREAMKRLGGDAPPPPPPSQSS